MFKKNFLAIPASCGPVAYYGLITFFVFAMLLGLFVTYLPELLKMVALQLFLFVLLVALYLKGWRPLWGPFQKVALWILGIFFWGGIGLFLLDVSFKILRGSTPPSFPLISLEWILLAGVLAPFLEELFFRDVLFKVVYQKTKKIFWAVILTSLLFMMAHMNLYGGPLLLGMISSLLFWKSSSILPSIFFHSLCNLSWVVLPLYFPHLFRWLLDWNLLQQFFR